MSNSEETGRENSGKKIGLIAGYGQLPLFAAKRAGDQGFQVIACLIEGEADGGVEKISHGSLWVKLGELGKVVQFFRSEGVSEILLLGKIHKVSLFSGRIRPDFEMVKALATIRDWKDDSLLGAVVASLGKHGIRVLDSTLFFREDLLVPGVITRLKPTKAELQDIEFGWSIAKAMGGLDIGQTVVVKSKAVLAVEAIEGTDEAIRRGGKLGGEGATVIKVSKPRQDQRFDVPVVGPMTLRVMREAKARVLALEAGTTILCDREEVLSIAEQAGISIIAK
ncbi:MAG TPA: UDP-2,3-diacylglucosamine diphosphatase LpxI [Candidatus Omnitrophota bacterium]|nr:UDP-2,3-diacylglucosamine diphosphatase LpxI [Candidatus Omnitrophota bacterium]